jgi:uncharacterized protein (DUF2132 family)
MKRNPNPIEVQKNNPLHGVRLSTIMDALYAQYGWEGLAERVNLSCFKSNPTMKSSLNFIQKTQWAREKIEQLYIETLKAAPVEASERPAKPSPFKAIKPKK